MLHEVQRRLLRWPQDNTTSDLLQREQLDATLLCTLARRNHSFGNATFILFHILFSNWIFTDFSDFLGRNRVLSDDLVVGRQVGSQHAFQLTGPFSFPDSRDLFSRIDFPPLLRKGGKWILEKRLKSIPIKKWEQEASIIPESTTADFLPTWATIWIL